MRIIFFILFISCSAQLIAIDFSNLNTSYWYESDPEIEVRFNVAQYENRLHLFIRIDTDSLASNNIKFLLQKDFEDPNHTELNSPTIDTLLSTGSRLILALILPVSDQEIIVVHCETPKFNYYFPKELTKGGIQYPAFYLTNIDGIPIFDRFLSNNPFGVTFVNGSGPLFFLQYQENFPAADPPMAEPMPVSMSIEVDSIFSQVRDFALLQNYFYFIQTDTLANQAVSIYNGTVYFPKYRTVEALIAPLKYVTRLSEYGTMLSSNDLKSAFDKFWISTFASKQRARTAIREYYRRVTLTNKLYTHYKAGWKTDRGIIHIVYGDPQEVYRSDTNEIWTYPEGIQFEFRILSNLFTPELYVLKRAPEYRDSWISRVRAFRNGS